MPSGTIRAIEFARSTPDGQIRRIWDAQLRAAEELVRSCALAQTKWNACIRGSISAESGKFQTVAAKQLLHQLNVGGAALIGPFAYGFPTAGKISQEFLSPGGKKSADRLPVSGIFDSPLPASGREPPNLA